MRGLDRASPALLDAIRYVPVEIDGRRLEPDSATRPIPLTPGERRIAARAPDGRQAVQTLSIEPSARAKLELRFQPVPSDPPARAVAAPRGADPPGPREPGASQSDGASSLRTVAYVAGGVGALGFVAFGVFGAMNSATYHDLEDSCADSSCAAERADDIDRGRRYQLFANLGLGVGIAGAVAGTLTYVISLGSESELEATAEPGGVTLRGRF